MCGNGRPSTPIRITTDCTLRPTRVLYAEDSSTPKMGGVVPGANREHYLEVDEVVDVVRYLIRLGGYVKLGPQILLRTMRNPMATGMA